MDKTEGKKLPDKDKQRFMSKVKVVIDGCWEWEGSTDRHGYGYFWFAGKIRKAHRFSYTLCMRDIPEGLTIDHLCRNPACVNPQHLEPVTQKENVNRGERWTEEKRATHCPQGHAYAPDNAYINADTGYKWCKICKLQRQKAWKGKPENRAKTREYPSYKKSLKGYANDQ